MSASHHTKYADRYDTGYHPFYLKSSNVRPLVIHPEIKNDIILNISHGLELDELYYNSALSRFPGLAGPGREPCGYDIDVADIATLASLLGQIGATTGSPGYTDIIKDIDGARSTFNTLPATEREALISARLGQGLFRTRLMSVWKGRCAVTDIQIPALLRASHIKPWRMSDNSERLDPENGLLLVANLDAAFDAGLLSFTDTGRMLFSATRC
jgi:hypothetical protein